MSKLDELRKLREKININVEGLDNIKKDSTNLFVANYNLLKDIFYLPMAVDMDVVQMISPILLYKNEETRKEVVNRYLNGLPIEAHGGKNYIDICLSSGVEILKNNISLAIFPEGAYISEDEIHKGRTGAIRMLFSSLDEDSSINLIPVAIDTKKANLDDYSFNHDEVTVKILEPIDYQDNFEKFSSTSDFNLKCKCLHEVMDEAMKNISKAINKRYVDSYISLRSKNNVMFSNGVVLPVDIAQNGYYLDLYKKETEKKVKKYVKAIKK